MAKKTFVRECCLHRHGGRFYNYDGQQLQRAKLNLGGLLFDAIGNRLRFSSNRFTQWFDQQEIVVRSVEPRITWIGHASFLIQIGNINIITDPIFDNVSPLFPRLLEPGISFDNLPSIDVVLISHNHRDHMDAPALQKIKFKHPEAQFLVPWGNKQWFDKRGFKKVFEHLWWQDRTISEVRHSEQKIIYSFLPAYHWSQRGIFDRNRSLWGSWMINWNGFKIYFAGDTAYADHFTTIAKKFSDIEVALMPIAPCEPDEYMRDVHLSAQEAGQAFLDLGAKNFIPMHWATFYFGADTFEGPIVRLRRWWREHEKKNALGQQYLHILKVGQVQIFKHLPGQLYPAGVTSIRDIQP